MDNKNSDDPGSSKKSDLIIITPDELAKLGLFQQVQTAVKPANEKNFTSILNLKQKIRNKFQEATIEAAKNQPKVVEKLQVQQKKHCATELKIKNVHTSTPAVTCNSKSLPKDINKPLVSSLKQYAGKAKVNKIDHSIEKPQLLDSTMSAKNTAAVHSTAAPKILNSYIKFDTDTTTQEKEEKVTKTKVDKDLIKSISQKNISSTEPVLKNREVQMVTQNTKNESVKILSSEIVFANFKPLDRCSSPGTDQVMPQVIEDSESISNTCLSGKQHNIFKNAREVSNRCSVDTKTINSFDRTENDKYEDITDRTGYEESVKKEVTVISNTPVCFSNEDLKHLVFNAKSKHHRLETSTQDNLKISSPNETAVAATESVKILPIKKDIDKIKGQKVINMHLESSGKSSDQKNVQNDTRKIISKNIPEINEDKITTINIEEESIESLVNSKDDQCHKISQEIRKQLKIVPPKKRSKILKNDSTANETLSEDNVATNTGFRNISELVKNRTEGNVKKGNVNKSRSNTTKIGKKKYICKSSTPFTEPKKFHAKIVKTYGRKTDVNQIETEKDEREDTLNKHSKIEEDMLIKSINVEEDVSLVNTNKIDKKNKVMSIAKKLDSINVSQLKAEISKIRGIEKSNMENNSVNSKAPIQLNKKQNTGSVDKNNVVIDLTDEATETSLDVSCKAPLSDSSVPSVKKRGRAKKIIDTTKTESAGGIFPNDCHSSSGIESAEMITSTPKKVPKKRGRKKKEEVTPVVEEPIKEVELEESRSGRKRKKINYFEMENNVENYVRKAYRKRKIPLHNRESSEQNSPKSLKVDSHNKGNSSMSCKDDSIGKTDMDFTSQEESNLASCGQRDSESIFEASKSELENIGQEIDTQNDNDEKPEDGINDSNENTVKLESARKRKNKGNGGASTLNSIFSAAFTNKSKNESEAEAETEASNIASSNTGHQNLDNSHATIDESEMVTCVLCNKKVNTEEWESHKRKIHYNLAWREGEPELKLDDVHFIAETLTPILEEEKKLKCYNCAKKHKTVEHFITHMEECGGLASIPTGFVTCAVCQEEVQKNQWFFHKQRKHNNLAWRNGEPPLDLNDQGLVIGLLNAMYKAKKPMRCEKCGTSKKSVIGFLSHRSQCGEVIEEVKVKCHLCDRKVLPVSMQSHIKLVHEKPKNVKVPKKSDFFDVDTELPQRKAAQRAMLVIDMMNGQAVVQDHTEHYLENTNFEQESFVKLLLKQELREDPTFKCKFKDCVYEVDKVTYLLQHMDSCQNKPEEYYTCTKCFFICDTEEEIIKHLKTVHHIGIIDHDFQVDPLEENEVNKELQEDFKRKMLSEKKKGEKDVNYKIKPTFLLNLEKKNGRLFSAAYNYTVEFCQKYFSSDILFDNLRYSKTDWKLLDDHLIEEYFPKYAQSCDIAVKKVTDIENVLGHEYLFKKLELFKPEYDNGIVTIFCGGPVYAMAWTPTPYTSFNSRQVLAVATANDFDMKYVVNNHYNESSVIQFWDFGALTNKQKMPEPKLMFCLAFDFGPVWHLEWCPSGCFDSKEDCDGKMSRLGLIAVAGTDSVVYIYSVPALEEKQMGLIYKVKPLLKLSLVNGKENLLGKDKFYATKISWGMGEGHRYIAVGYSDGMVGLFDVDTKSVFLRCKDEDGVDVLLPYKSFQAHVHYISALTLIHLNNGRRWLLTGSFDRCSCVWDLHDGTKYYLRKCIVSDGTWLPNWMVYIAAAEESSTTNGPTHMVLKSHRGYLYEYVYVTNSRSSITSVSTSSWLNGFLQCNSVGEIIGFFPHQLTYAFDSDKLLKRYTYVFGYTKLIDKHKNPQERVAEEIEKQKALKPVLRKNDSSDSVSHILAVKNCHYNKYEPTTYLEACEKYGLTFCDMKMDHFRDFQKSQSKIGRCGEALELSKPNLYSMQAINKVAYNPNLQASLYYATGYQMGFVRVTYMKFLENDPQIV